MARLIGDAYIVIYPQTDQFGPLLKAAVTAQVNAIRPKVNVTPQLDKAAAAAIETELKSLGGQELTLDAMLSASSIAAIRAELNGLTSDVKLGADLDPAALARVEAELKAVSDNLQLGASVDPAALARIAYELRAIGQNVPVDLQLDSPSLYAARVEMQNALGEIRPDLDIDPASLAAARAQLASVIANVPLNFSPAQVAAAVADLNMDLRTGITTVNIPVGLSLPELTAAAASLNAYMRSNTATVQVPVQVSQAQLAAAVASLDAYLRTGITTINIPVGFSAAQVAVASIALNRYIQSGITPATVPVQVSKASLAAMNASINAYLRTGTTAVNIPVQLNQAQLAAMRASLSAYLNAAPVSVNVSTASAMTKVAALGAYTSQVMGNAFSNVNVAGALAKILSLQAAAASIGATFSAMANTSNVLNMSLSLAGASANSLMKAFITMVNGGGAWGVLTSRITLFAGALNQVLPEVLSSVSVWHLATDWVLEFAAVLVPASLAVTAWGAVMAFVAADALTKFQAISAAATVTGEKIGSFNSNLKNGIGPLQSLQNYLNPTVWELYGDAMTVATSKSSVFTGIVKQVNTVVEDLAARMTAAFSSTGVQTFMQNGALDFQRFGTIIGNLGGAFGNFVKDVPGYAEIIEELFEKITAGIEAFTAFAGPVIQAGLAMHGFILYVGLALTAGVSLIAGIGNVTAKFFTFAASAVDLSTISETIQIAFLNAGLAITGFIERIALLVSNPYVVALAAIGLAAYDMVEDFDSASSAVSNWARNLTQGIAQMQGGAALQSISEAFGKITTQIQLASSPAAYNQIAANWNNLSNTGNAFAKDSTYDANEWISAWSDLGKALLTSSGWATTVSKFGNAIADMFVTGKGVTLQVAANVGALENAYQQLSVQQQNLLVVTGQLMTSTLKIPGTNQLATTTTYSYAQSLGILNAAGVQSTDSLATMETKVASLLQGYQTLGLTAGQVGNAVNAMTFATQLGQTGITKMTQGYSSFISTITGGETAFTTFGEGLATLAQAFNSAGIATYTDKLGTLQVKTNEAATSMDGLSAADLNVRGAFATEITNATNLYNSLLTLATVSDAGAKGQGLLAQAGKDMVATLLPLAKGSATAMSEVSALAQIAGGPATTSFQTLSNWVGKVQNPMQQLNSIEGKLTVSSVNLETDANNLAGAFGVTLTSAISGALFAAEKGPQALQGLATALAAMVNGTGSATDVEAALRQLIPALTLMTGSGKNAEAQFLAMGGALHISQSELAAMWDAAQPVPGTLINAAAAAKSFTAAVQDTGNVLKGIPGVLTSNLAGYTQLQAMLAKTDTGLTNNTSAANLGKQAFINFAEQGLHQTAAQATALWANINDQNLVKLGDEATTTKTLFIQLAENGMGLTKTQATALWTTLRLQYLDTLASKAGTTESSFVALAKSGLNLSNTAAENLWTSMRQQYLDTLASKAGETETAFEGVAKQFGLNQTAAEQLWTAMHTLASGSPYNANVNATIGASGEVSVLEDIAAPGVAVTKNILGELTFSAAGGIINGKGPSGKDSTLVMAAPGEAIIPTAHVPKIADMARKASIPGFTAGGLVAGAPGLETQLGQIVPTTAKDVGSYAQSVIQAFVTGASKTADASATAMLPTVGAQTSTQIVSILEQALKITNTPLSWLPALETLVSKESSGNASAVDPISVDGQHATGLFQTLPSTFAQYAMPGYAAGPTNALDDAIAGIRYIKAEYGTPAAITGIGKPGTYEGYSAGGMVNEPVFGYGKFSGMPYSFAENGPEQVIPGGAATQSQAGLPGLTMYQGNTLIQLLQQQNKLLGQMPYTQAQAINQANATGVRRGYFATSG